MSDLRAARSPACDRRTGNPTPADSARANETLAALGWPPLTRPIW
jgi:hypothetical protein